MDQFTDVTVVKKANSFFDGAVTSRTVIFRDGSKKTLGIAQPGEYTFNTDAAEVMEILAGQLDVQIAGGDWKKVSGGESFEVPAKSSFTMKVKTITDYCCSFLA